MRGTETAPKVWFITGASRGFGSLIAKAALEKGDAVVASARDPAAVTAVLGSSSNLLAAALDVTHESQALAAVDAAIARFGRIDVLVNNAGYGLLGAVEEASGAEVERVFATNVFGLLNVTRAVLPHLRRARAGHVINLSSIGGYRAASGWGIYCATKFAVEGLSESMHAELAPLGIHVTVVEPGYFRTDFLGSVSLTSTAMRMGDYVETVGAMRSFAAAANRQQPGDPGKLAAAVLNLASMSHPPLRLPLGADTVRAIDEKNRFVDQEIARLRDLALSTDAG
jgi:NAD(P)-dependent dehydrogenase (short-subunit alcohol dehydrogenase family)